MVKLENTVIEAIFNTMGAKTMISQNLVCDLNWEIKNPSKGKSLRSYLEPGGKPMHNFGHILGSVGTSFSLEIVVNVQKIKAVEHADLLFFIRVNILCRYSRGQKTCFYSI